jgi:hypothetical protein
LFIFQISLLLYKDIINDAEDVLDGISFEQQKIIFTLKFDNFKLKVFLTCDSHEFLVTLVRAGQNWVKKKNKRPKQNGQRTKSDKT